MRTPSRFELKPQKHGTSVVHLAFAFALPRFTRVNTCEMQTQAQMQAQGNEKFSISCVGVCVCVLHACLLALAFAFALLV